MKKETFLKISQRFPSTFRRILKICAKAKRTFPVISRRFTKIIQDCWRVLRKIWRCFDHTTPNLSAVEEARRFAYHARLWQVFCSSPRFLGKRENARSLGSNMISVESSTFSLVRIWKYTSRVPDMISHEFYEWCSFQWNTRAYWFNNYSSKWRLISTTFTDTEMNNYLSIYHTRWTTSGPKSNFSCENIPTKPFCFSSAARRWIVLG